MMTEKSKAPAIDGAVLIIDILANSLQPLTLTEICEKTALPVASAYRLLSSLLAHEMVVLSPSRKKSYCIGPKIFQVASTVYSQQSLIPFFYPIAEILKNEIHHPIFLSVPVGDTVVVVAKLELSSSDDVDVHIGQTMPLYSSAAGKAILSMFEDSDRQGYLLGQKKRNARFYEKLPKLQEDLTRAKRLGYAVNHNEAGSNSSGIAAPVLNLQNEPIAVINTRVAHEPLLEQDVRDISKRLIQAARQLSSRINMN